MTRFLVCDYCGVAFDVGVKKCRNGWCKHPKNSASSASIPKAIKERKVYKQQPKPRSFTRWSSIVIRSRKRGYECNISEQDIIELINKPCVYCGSTNRIEVDRKDNDLGYTLGNIAPACHRCNTIKNNVVSYDEMIKIAEILQWRVG